eukprot:5164558-Amphidinium_carterae.1
MRGIGSVVSVSLVESRVKLEELIHPPQTSSPGSFVNGLLLLRYVGTYYNLRPYFEVCCT